MRSTLLPLRRLHVCHNSRIWLALHHTQRTGSYSTSNSSTAQHNSMTSWTSLPWQGNLKNMDSLPTLTELCDLLQSATAAVHSYKEANPHVQNLNKLANRIKRDLSFIQSQRQLLEQQNEQWGQVQADTSSCLGGLGEGRLQGIVNNLRGFHGELIALHEAPGVIAVCQKFKSAPPKIWAPACNISQKPAEAPTSAAAAASAAGSPGTTGRQFEQHIGSSSNSVAIAASPARTADAGGSSDSSSDDSGAQDSSILHHSDGSSDSRHRQRRQQQIDGDPVRGMRTYTLLADAVQDSSGGTEAVAAPAAAASAAAPLWVEVDVVANNGLTWIEVKNQERFGLESVHWQGAPGHSKGLAQQIRDLQTVAAAPVNSRRWRAPEIVVFFPSAADEGVADALRDIGVTVAVGPGSLAQLPVPHPPTVTNLDVTSLCALVSEVSWGDPHTRRMQDWAARTVHWRDCLAAQIASPLLDELHACLDDSQQLVTSCAAVEQFQKLMDQFSGPSEQERWKELQQRLHVYHCSSSSGSSSSGRCEVCGNSSQGSDSGLTGPGSEQAQQEQLWYTEPERVSRVDKLTRQQRAVLGLGDALEALTLTANGNAIRCCEHYGVKLEAVVHRPVWLTGM